ncbi:MAG: DHHA1 domain-containing protein [Nanoarchaeota archaeon]|nr:DHHA1 domain-containing protein [Nanoarchaeota archaeon]
MDIVYLKGSKDDFLRFLDSIGLYDKVAILTHTDLDGIASGLFIEKILEARGIKVDYINFLEIKRDMVKEISLELKDKGITKVFFSDLNVESIDLDGFNELREEKDVFLIDHHPVNSEFDYTSNVIKSVSGDCCALVTFVLGEGLIEYESWGWLVSAAIFADYAFRSEKNFQFMESFYPELSLEGLSSSVPGLNARRISSALVYYKNDIKHVYEMVKEKKMDEILEIYELIEEEVYRIVDDFEKEKKYFSEKDIYFYEINSRFDVLSYVATLIAGYNPNKNFIFMYKSKEHAKFSARSPNSIIDMGKLMSEAVQGLSGANGGGHISAAAAGVLLEDEEIFKKRVFG